MLPPLHPEGDPRQTAVEPSESPDFSRELVDPIGYPEMNPTKKNKLLGWVGIPTKIKQTNGRKLKEKKGFTLIY